MCVLIIIRMNILKNSKFYFSDLLELDIRTNENSVSKELVLEKIEELSEKQVNQ